MGPCERNADRWLDHLYGLLDETESRELADHLRLCAACQASLAEAQADQQRLSRAANWHRQVPEFELPEEERKSNPAPALAPPVPTTLPFQKHVRRSLAQRLWPTWVAAAALLLAIFGGNELYRRGSQDREQAVADAKKQVQEIEGRFVALKLKADAEQQEVLKQTKAETLRLFVVGAAQTHPDAPYTCRIATQDYDGKPKSAHLEVRLVRADTGAIVHQQAVASTGDTEVLIPAGLKLDQNVRLEVAAKHGAAQAEVREALQVASSDRAVHLALDKSLYQLGEVVFVRALLLDRFSLKPTMSSGSLKFALMNAQGKKVFETPAAAGPGGIASGEFALTDQLPIGAYTIEAIAADGKPLMLATARSIEVVDRLGDLEVRPDRKQYRAGDKVVMQVVVRGADGKPLKNQLVVAKPELKNNAGILGSTGVRAFTDADGKATLPFPLPKNFDGSRLNIHFEVPGQKKEIKGVAPKTMRTITIVPARLEIDFYPEGGDLVAGLPQRVFYRVRTPAGETAAPDGSFTLQSDKGEIYKSEPNQSLGSFTLTPDPNANYTVRMPAGSGVGEIKTPFARLGIKQAGIVLHATNSVSRAGEPIRLELRRNDSKQRLLAVASCRGQIVGQQFIEASAKQVDVQLPDDVRGIVRLSIYGVRDGRLVPLAERLVYRAPAQTLELKTTTTNALPGQTAQLTIDARDEKGQPANAWALAAVVDDHYRAERSEGDLAGYFLLASEFGGDLADMPLLTDAGPANRNALELFLGTRGWRRFVEAAEPAQIAKEVPSPRLFSAGNASADPAQLTAKVQRSLATLQQRIDHEQAQLTEQRGQLTSALTVAREARNAYERMPAEVGRLALGVLTAAAFIVGGLFLVFGLVRAARRRASTPAFASAFAALGLCLILYFSASAVPQIVPHVPNDGGMAAIELPRIDVALVKNLGSAPPPFTGPVALAAPPTSADPAVQRLAAGLLSALVWHDPIESPREAPSKHVLPPALQERFQATAQVQLAADKPGPNYGREYAFQSPATGATSQPTLLWHPQLNLANGQASVAFDVPSAPARYRILIVGHSAEGRLGFTESRFEVKPK